jgi:hypothetical protein
VIVDDGDKVRWLFGIAEDVLDQSFVDVDTHPMCHCAGGRLVDLGVTGQRLGDQGQ